MTRAESQEYQRRWYQANKVKKKVQARNWRKLNPERAKEISLNYRRRNPHVQLAWQSRNKDKCSDYCKAWRDKPENKAWLAEYAREYRKDRGRIAWLLRSRLSSALKRKGARKSISTLDLVGCSLQQLKVHLESQFREGMSWDNHGQHGWHIDHIIPCFGFNLNDSEEQKQCFHYTNLQPLWAHENHSKKNKIR